jgi:hypothetical protein
LETCRKELASYYCGRKPLNDYLRPNLPHFLGNRTDFIKCLLEYHIPQPFWGMGGGEWERRRRRRRKEKKRRDKEKK